MQKADNIEKSVLGLSSPLRKLLDVFIHVTFLTFFYFIYWFYQQKTL